LTTNRSIYLSSVARNQEEYYTGAGEAPGYWLGTGARLLSVAGEVSPDGLHRILHGAHPDTAERLGAPARMGRVAGFDLAFRAPKSVALVYALGALQTAGAVRDAHARAVAAAVGYVERHATLARRGAGGLRLVDGEGLVAAAYAHRTSRAGDPLLHTHVLVANLTCGPDGRWTALDGRAVYAHAKTTGYLYQAVLRRELTRSLGVAWGPVRNGAADLAGVPRAVIEAFSQRRRLITARMRLLGVRSAKGAQAVTLATRTAKETGVTEQGLRERWRRRAAAHGFGERKVAALLGRAEERPLAEADSACETSSGTRLGFARLVPAEGGAAERVALLTVVRRRL
jgi:conjugative relaxase-like TrwC/TraI family protein